MICGLIRSLGAALALYASAATAQELEFYYEEPLEGVYSQGWYGRVIGADRTSGILVMVRGDGKSGDFYGVLNVNCDTPEFSGWVAQGGYLTPDRVPANVISIVRAEACGSP